MDIDLVCKVVDNYGDIGVVYRLARALSALSDAPRLRLIVDELSAFASLDPAIDPKADYQVAHGWEIFGWRLSEAALAAFAARPPRCVIECFACGRPDWYEAILFAPGAGESLIVDLEYLTAEAYAGELHRMPSLTRSANVRKAMFLPGFTEGTGGLIIDPEFAASRGLAASGEGRAGMRRELLAGLGMRAAGLMPGGLPPGASGSFWFLVFSYERDYSRIVAELAAFARGPLRSEGRGLLALAAAGRSHACFLTAWREAGEPFPLLELPFLPQETWDSFLLASDFSIVRGEDSWARAALSGRPFLWQAYPQEGRHHMVKVKAFLELLRRGAAAEAFAPLEALFRAFNDRDLDLPSIRGEDSLLPVLERYDALLPTFRAFSEGIAAREDLAANLLTFLGEML